MTRDEFLSLEPDNFVANKSTGRRYRVVDVNPDVIYVVPPIGVSPSKGRSIWARHACNWIKEP